MSKLWRLSSTMIFTLSMLMVLVVAGVYGRSHVGTLDSMVHQRMGLSADLLWKGEVHRVLTSLIFTPGGWHFYSSFVMFSLSVGWLECQRGTLTAGLVFFGVHVATLLLMVLGIAFENWLVQSHSGSLLWFTRDVGPSAGYYGCLGLALMMQPAALRRPIIIAMLIVLLLRLGYSTYCLHESTRSMSADIAHLIAFSLGLSLAQVLHYF